MIYFSVLNLIITGIPSIPLLMDDAFGYYYLKVLNLIITGIPSILGGEETMKKPINWSFKPYYNWNTFNTIH